MRKRKALAMLLSLVLILSLAVPGTLAVESTGAPVDDSVVLEFTGSEGDEIISSTDELEQEPQQNDLEGSEGSTEQETEQVNDPPEGGVQNSDVDDNELLEQGAQNNYDNEQKSDSLFEGDSECTCGTESDEHVEDCPCYVEPQIVDEKPEEFDVAAVYEYIMQLDDDAKIENYLQNELTEEQRDAILEYAEEVHSANSEEIVTVPFTDAGPFRPAVNVQNVAKGRNAQLRGSKGGSQGYGTEDSVSNDGIVTEKTVQNIESGRYKIRLESYVTGATTTSTVTTTTPVDIVLVLDQSGSMAYNFNGDYTSTNSARRQYAMKQAVNNFIDSVATRYDADTADHRMAIVTFGSNASNLQGWTYVDSSGVTTLHTAINVLSDSPSGSTRVDKGMSNAVDLMNSGYNYTGTNNPRQKVIIVFTDGVPTSSSNFETDVADNALGYAKTLKDGGATVYTIGIFNGANVVQLHGDKWDYAVHGDILCSGLPGSYWGGSWASSLFGNNDFDVLDVPACNRFMNYLSTNFATAAQIGITKSRYNPGDYFASGGTGWKIDSNETRTTTGYYLTANDSESLSQIFTTISDNIQTGGASITLGTSTVVQDVVTDYFQIPNGASSITVKTADCTSFTGETPNWTNEQEVQLPVDVNGNTIQVTGFDFSTNWVGKDTTTNQVHPGKKLIIEITIEPKDGFLGGNNIPTNVASSSGVFTQGGEAMETFPTSSAKANVPIQDISVTAKQKDVYLLGDLTNEQLLAGATATCNGAHLTYGAVNYGLEDWQNEFVSIDFATEYTDGVRDLNADTTYEINVIIKPPEPISGGIQPKTGSGAGSINVYTPTMSFKDTSVYYGDTAPTSYDENLYEVVWMHGEDEAPSTMGEAPKDFVITCAPVDSSDIVDGKINSKNDIPIKITSITLDDTNILQYVSFAHEECDPVCGWTDPDPANPVDRAFLLHVKTCQLTITKNGGADGETYVFKVYKDNQPYTEVSIKGNDSVTIYELPVGTYTIVEDSDWSWRYSATYGEAVTLSSTTETGTISCSNSIIITKIYWLNYYSDIKKNTYGILNS